ncbi:DUF6266 family protein [Draconibacterium halophilum]|uniref:Uncharacterized protein n=1 Tax=Draconibacterium halophilum TaxID=2706887 RepID=A0A6C0RDR5_9BACT|nr:DUF6266 family protein [Draconibacterium halophilum]QIA08259.1 hypothetical protein G0Q07_11275 [Draconibacterium halophilum]
MAKVANVLIGKSSGSVGGTTFSSWKGINVLKAKPTVVANPQTDKQKAQRAAFSFMVGLYRTLVAVIVIGFKELAVKKSQFNAFQSANLKAAFDLSAPPAATLLPAEVSISKGTIADTPIDTVVASEAANTVVFNYADTANDPGQSAGDKPLMVVFNETKEEWTCKVGAATRGDGTDSLPMLEGWEEADVLHCYLGFSSVDGDTASDSQYKAGAIVA